MVTQLIVSATEVCGTNRAYNRHVRRGEPTDDACRAAHTAFNAARQTAQQRAHARLAQEFEGRFQQLYTEELRTLGLKITPQSRTNRRPS